MHSLAPQKSSITPTERRENAGGRNGEAEVFPGSGLNTLADADFERDRSDLREGFRARRDVDSEVKLFLACLQDQALRCGSAC